MKINSIQKINLPFGAKSVISVFLERGGVCEQIYGSNSYSVYFKKDLFNFIDMYTPAISYVYGILFLNKKNILNILKQNDIKVSQGILSSKNYRIFITRSGYYNILIKLPTIIIGNGISTLKELISMENLKRVNSEGKNLPLKIAEKELILHDMTFSSLLKKNEKIIFTSIVNWREGAKFKDVTDIVGRDIVMLARKILSIFPNLAYVGFDCDSEGVVGNVDLSLDPNIFYRMSNGVKKKRAIDVVVDLIVGYN